MLTIKMFRDRVVLILAACVAVAGAAQAQTEPTASIIAKFSGTNGSNPASPLIQLPSGNLLGLTLSAAYYPKIPSTLFQILHTGAIQTVYVLAADGSQGAMDGGFFETNGLVQASDGNIYGLTYSSRNETGAGLAFRFSFPSTFEVLHNFGFDAGNYAAAVGSLVQAQDGNLYGVTTESGANGLGGLFKLGLDGTYQGIYSFSNDLIGGAPFYGLVAHPNGLLYGFTSTAEFQGLPTYGSIFSFDPSTGTLSFVASSSTALFALTVGSDGDLYAVANAPACANCSGAILRYGVDGSGPFPSFIFPAEHGVQPSPGLTEISSGLFLNAASPVLLANTQTGELTQIPLPQHITANLLGNFTETAGGKFVGAFPQTTPSPYFGVIVEIDAGFPKPLPSITGVYPSVVSPGQLVTVLGANLIGATNVSLGGQSVSFSVKASGAITFTAPPVTLSGTVTVSTPGGTATSWRDVAVN